MIRFSSLERLGVRVAAMSDKSDGDCRLARAENGIEENGARSRFCQSLNLQDGEVQYVKLVHGVDIVTVREAPREVNGFCGDGMIGGAGCAPMGITAADCVPVLLYDPVSKSGGLLHAGREGTAGNISGRAVQALEETFGAAAGNLRAVIGPSAGPCCYEVSAAMADDFREKGLPAEGRLLDLWRANASQLAAAGVAAEHVEVTGICTICGAVFHSHRAGADGKRNAVILAL